MKIFIKISLVLTFIIIITVIIFTLLPSMNLINNQNAATIAASLAVIAALVSAWGAIKVVEQSEDIQKPYPYPSFDTETRYGLVQLVIRNYGGSPAHNIKLEFDQPVLNGNGDEVKFSTIPEQPDVVVLLQGERISILIGRSQQVLSKYSDLNFSGLITYENSSRKKFKEKFHISLEQYRETLFYSNEDLRTSFELQKIPNEIKKLSKELKELKDVLKLQANDGGQ